MELIQQDDQLVKLVIEECQEQAHTAQKPDESRLDDLRQQDARLSESLKNLVGNVF